MSLERQSGGKVKLGDLPTAVTKLASNAKLAIRTAMAYGEFDATGERVDWTWDFLKRFVAQKPEFEPAFRAAARDERVKKDLMTYASGPHIFFLAMILTHTTIPPGLLWRWQISSHSNQQGPKWCEGGIWAIR